MSLRPNTEWSMNGDDVEGIIWHTENVQPLTAAEVAAEMQRLEAEAVTAAEAVAAGQAAAVAHAKSLGFTDEMIAGMWPGLGGAL
jgi:hypothetical protein